MFARWLAAVLCAALVWFADEAGAQSKRAKGWVREPAHIKATIPLMLRFQDYLPEEVDLSSKFPTPGDQGQQSSCTAWATGYAMRSYYEGQRRNWNFSSPVQVISPAYIYNKLHDFRGNCDTGTAISDALGVLKSDGAPTLSAYPYFENDCSRPASPQLVRDSSAFRISGWNALDNKRLDDAKGQLAHGHPVVFGMEVSEQFENLQGSTIYDDVSSPRTGGHAMVLVGYSERRQAFKVMNSWGTEWGEGGFGWISYRAVRQLSDLMFTMDVPAIPAPAPAPPPVVVAPPAPQPPVVKPEPAPPVVTPPPVVKPQPAPPVVVAPPQPQPQPSPTPVPPKPVVTPPVVVAPPPQPVPAPPKPVVTPTVVIPPVAEVRKSVAARAGELRCARIVTKLGNDRVAQVRGFAGYANEVAKLEAELATMPGVKRVDSKITLYPWPQCEVFLNFADGLKTPRGLAANLRGNSSRNFAGGDSLAIDVTTPSYPSYLYVTYLQASGDAANLAWPEGKFPKAVPPNTKITFGGGNNGEPVYRIAPPFGDEIVVIVASASPLFQDELPDTSTSRDYLTSFRKSFLVKPKVGGGNRTVSVIALPIKTQARQ